MKKFLRFALCLLIVIFACEAAFASIRLGVMQFVTKADGVTEYQASAAGDVFVRILANNVNNISILERERLEEIGAEIRLGMSGLVSAHTAAQVGKIAGCQYMLMGSVTNLKSKSSNVTLPFAIGIGVRESAATATLDVRIVDVETSEIVGALSDSGTGKQSGTSLSVMGVAFDSDELSGMEAEAIAKASEKLAPKIEKLLLKAAGTSGNPGDISFRPSRTASTYAEQRAEEAQTQTMKTTRKTPGKRSRVTTPAPVAPAETEDYYDDNQQEVLTTQTASRQTQTQMQSGEFENYSTNPEDVIPTYGLDEKQSENLITAHNRFWRASNKRSAYDRFVGLYNSNNNDYLAAYRAGILAQQLGMRDDANAWFETALSINPNYEPAQKAKSNVNARPSSKKSSSSKSKRRKK